jgi:uncharacterized membrane protein YuzA (DUF378 family)
MNNLAKTRRQFTLILAVLGAVNLLLIVYLLLPGSSASGKAAREQSLQTQVKSLGREVTPLRGDVQWLYAQKIPGQFSQISQHFYKLVEEAGVTAQGIHYTEDKTGKAEKHDLPDVQRIDIDTTVSGDYAKVAHFINAMEQDKFVFIIDQISLNSQESGIISLQIKFQTFLKES